MARTAVGRLAPETGEFAAQPSVPESYGTTRYEQTRRAQARRARFQRVLLVGASIGWLALFSWAGKTLLEQQTRTDRVRVEASDLHAELVLLEGRNRELRDEVVRMGRDDYIEMVARRQLGLIRPGEIPYVTVGSSSPAIQPATGR